MFIPLTFLPESSGGGAVAIYGVSKELQCQGHEVFVLTAKEFNTSSTSSSTVITHDEVWDGFSVRRLSYNKQLTGQPAPWYDVLNPQIEQVTMEYLKQYRPDVVHVTCGQHLSISPILAAQKLGLPVVLTLIGFWYICPLTILRQPDGTLCEGRKTGIECLGCLTTKKSRIFQSLDRLPDTLQKWGSVVFQQLGLLTQSNKALQVISAVDYRNKIFAQTLSKVEQVLAPSNVLRDLFIETGIIAADRIMYWQYSIDTKKVISGRDKSPSSALRLGYTGHMYRQKGIDILIRAVSSLPLELPVILKLYGDLQDKDPQYGDELLTLAGDDPRIKFMGRYDNQCAGEILQKLDVVVVPSLWLENSPVSIHESLAAHTPVVATKLGGMMDLIQDNVNGLLFERGSVEDLSRQISRLCTEPGLLEQLRANAKPVRTVQDEAKSLLSLYEDLLTRRSTR
jgi:glycosyltransferase involved in cell wall biosynthesis